MLVTFFVFFLYVVYKFIYLLLTLVPDSLHVEDILGIPLTQVILGVPLIQDIRSPINASHIGRPIDPSPSCQHSALVLPPRPGHFS